MKIDCEDWTCPKCGHINVIGDNVVKAAAKKTLFELQNLIKVPVECKHCGFQEVLLISVNLYGTSKIDYKATELNRMLRK